MIATGRVISIDDDAKAGRIRARINGTDNKYADEDVPMAFPLIPKMIHVKPKVGEAVLLLFADDDNMRSQRFYLGPIISQPQSMYKDNYVAGATTTLRGGITQPQKNIDRKKKSHGAFGKDDDIIIYGRKNCDIILSDDDIRIRAGAHLVNESDKTDIGYNKTNPAFIKLKYHPLGVTYDGKFSEEHVEKISSSVNIVAQKINLFSTDGKDCDGSETCDVDEGISDEGFVKILRHAQRLPYGEDLVEFLCDFLAMFQNHVHPGSYAPPMSSDYGGKTQIFLGKYGGGTEDTLREKLLSKSVRIN